MAADKMYRLLRGGMTRWEVDSDGTGKHVSYEPGDVVKNLTQAEFIEHGKRFVVVTKEELARKADVDERLSELINRSGSSDDGENDWNEVIEGNLASVKEFINETLNDPALVESLLAAEMASAAPRKGVIDCANERIKALRRKDDK